MDSFAKGIIIAIKILICVLVAIYWISPIDLIPGFIGDDVVVLVLGALGIYKLPKTKLPTGKK